MYKVYLSPSTQDKSFGVGDFGVEAFRMNQIADSVQKYLLEIGEFAVFRNVETMTKDEIVVDSNEVSADIHIAIHTKYTSIKGPECYVKEGCERSNGFAKEVHKEIQKIYYNKEIDNGLVYEPNIKEINKVKNPAILIQVASHADLQDSDWIIKNIEKIAKAIAIGIQKGFRLKVC